MSRSWCVALLLALAASGCGTVNSFKTKAPDPGSNEGEWAVARSESTRRAVLYDQFQQRAIVTATYLSAGVRESRARRLGEWLGWTHEELDRRLQAEAAEAARYEEFLVALFVTDHRSNDLDRKESVWRVALLLDNGGELVSRDATALDVDANITSLFPFVSPFDTVYRVRFDHVSGDPLARRAFTMQLASAWGKMDLRYGDGAMGPSRPEGSLIP